jgi:MATE family multidrug resistance protein
VIAQALGAGDAARPRLAARHGTWLALALTPLTWLGCVVVGVALPAVGVADEVVPLARAYLVARAPSALPFFLYWAVKAWLQAHGATRAPVLGVVLGVVAQFFLDVALVLGVPSLGVPALGVVGAGIAHTATSTLRLVVVVVAAERLLVDPARAGEVPPSSWSERAARMRAALVARELLDVLRIGGPLGMTIAVECAIFAFAATLMGRIGAVALASHQVAMQCATITFSVMVGLASAASIVVARRIGAGDRRGALAAALASFGLAVFAMVVAGGVFFFGGAALARLLTDDPRVVEGAAALLAVGAAFQISDGLQTVAAGALRGAGDTQASFVAQSVAQWAIAMPCMLLFVGPLGLGATGVWWGLAVGLTVAAVALVARFVVRARVGYEPLAPTR